VSPQSPGIITRSNRIEIVHFGFFAGFQTCLAENDGPISGARIAMNASLGTDLDKQF